MKKRKNFLESAARAEYNTVRDRIKREPSMKFAMMLDNYGPFKRMKTYELYDEGFDWVRLKRDGKLYYVGKHLIHANPFEFINDEDYDDDGENWELGEDFIFQFS